MTTTFQPRADSATVVVAEDQPIYRSGLVGLISAAEGFDVVAVAADGREALDLVARHHPDLLLLDLELPVVDGFGVLHEVGGTSPTAVLVFSMHADDDSIFEAMRAGARGYLTKSAHARAVVDAARIVSEGGVVFSDAIAARLATWFTCLQRHNGPVSQLTPREREVLRLMVRGLDNRSIAAALGLHPKTVRNVVSTILAKLLVADRASAVAKARQWGLRAGNGMSRAQPGHRPVTSGTP